MTTVETPQQTGEKPAKAFLAGVLIKAFILFLVLNALYAVLQPQQIIGRMSVYNWLVPGRERLPFGEIPEQAYNLSLYQVDAMFRSHEIMQQKANDEFRVILIGDSSVWGYLLKPEEMLSAYLNDAGLTTPDGQTVRIYNLGYPTISVTKDLLLLSYALAYEPDLVVWLTTLEAMPANKQLSSPIVQNNAEPVRDLIETYNLSLDPDSPEFYDAAFWLRTIIGDRRTLADMTRLNLYGFMWASTGIDQYYPDSYEPRQEDFEEDDSFYDLSSPLTLDDLAFDVIAAGVDLAGDVPVLLVNEPMFISTGENSDIRYNFFYPRWAYDEYRGIFAEQAASHGWQYSDLWDTIPAAEFTNSAIHLTPEGSAMLADMVGDEIMRIVNGNSK